VSSVDLVQKMGKLAAPRVRTVAPEVSEALARVLDRALEFRREDRYESAAAMRADVRSALAVVGPGAPRTTPIGGGSYEPSIELSASDLEILKSVEIRGFQSIKSVELSASDLEVIKGDAVRAGEVAATGPAEPAKPSGVPPTAPMVVTPPVAQMPMQAIVAPTPSGPPAPAPQLLPAAPPTPPRQRSPLIVVGLAVVAVGVVCAGAAFAAGWFEESDTPSTASSGYSIPPAPTTHLSKPLPDDRSRTGKRPKH
jgi:serine/threonine-protein kinase